MKKLLILFSVCLLAFSCNNAPVHPKVEKLNTYEILLQNGDTTYIDAAVYSCYDGFFHTSAPQYTFYKNKNYTDVVSEFNNPVSVKKIR